MPIKPGFVFGGWYLPSATLKYVFNFPVTSSMTLTEDGFLLITLHTMLFIKKRVLNINDKFLAVNLLGIQ